MPPDNEVEAAEEEILHQGTAARMTAELKAEIESVKSLESVAIAVQRSSEDTKWRQLAKLFGDFQTSGRSRWPPFRRKRRAGAELVKWWGELPFSFESFKD